MTILDREKEARQRRWVKRAACVGCGTDEFYPSRGRAPHDGIIRTCQQCPVRVECLQYCMHTQTSHEDFGIWGGTTPIDRRGVRTAKAGGGNVGKAFRITRAKAEQIIAAADAKRNFG